MKKSLVRVAAVTLFAGFAITGVAVPALAAESTTPSNGGVVIVDEPDTTNLNNLWTFAPLGIPVLGLLQSVAGVPGKLLPTPGGY
ncbi:MAG: hypothetical protein JWQ81_4127 [Amycolatopsis sp.]|uniref:hypothetical protein n=1 Tax=Amycolatopsis sp. TaxID=37632 RepID=UPI002612E060|nr:hypothetical protein [Amycolatopsis sp.]MCU1683388.1 hypothetical protein [Amycolatopsis sp.]